MRTIEDIERDLENAKKEAEPIIEAREKAVKKINQYYHELKQFKMDNGLYHSMSELEKYKGHTVNNIELIEKEKDGTLSSEYMYNDEIFKVDENGHLDYSSYQCGIMSYSEERGKYIYSYYGHETERNFVGFLEIDVD